MRAWETTEAQRLRDIAAKLRAKREADLAAIEAKFLPQTA